MKEVLIFTAGVAIGSVVTWKLIEKKYRDLADEEIKSVVETFTNRKDAHIKSKKQEEVDRDNAIMEETINYKNKVNNLDYGSKQEIKKKEEDFDVITIIASEEYGDQDDWDAKGYMYWNDGIVTDEFDTIVDEPSKILGEACISSFETDPECECVYVRNSKLRCDYEVLRSEKDFNE